MLLVLLSNIVVSYSYRSNAYILFTSCFNADDHFEPLFTKRGKSYYRKECSFITDMHQEQALMRCGDKELEHWFTEREKFVPLHPYNPCDFEGIVFSGVEIWGKF